MTEPSSSGDDLTSEQSAMDEASSEAVVEDAVVNESSCASSSGVDTDSSKPMLASDMSQSELSNSEKADENKSAGSKDPSVALDKLAETQKSSWGWGNLSSWGTSVLNTAASSVTTFTAQVGEGLHQVLETVESGLLASDDDDVTSEDTDPAVLNTDTKETVTKQEMIHHGEMASSSLSDGEADKAVETMEESEPGTDDGWLSGWGLSGLVNKTSSIVQKTGNVVYQTVEKTSNVVQKTGSVVYQTVEKTTSASKKVISSGIDVLETIGKKTYDALAEDDEVLLIDVPQTRLTLSQRLREAKEVADSRAEEEEAIAEVRKSNFGAQFDEFQGIVQLEALESLFSASEAKVRGFLELLPKEAADPLKSNLMQIKKIFDTVGDADDDDAAEHDFAQLMADYRDRLTLHVEIQKLVTSQSKIRQWLSDCETSLQSESSDAKSGKEIHQMAIQSLAQMTSYIIEHWRHVGQQILLLQLTSASVFQNEAKELAAITKVFGTEIMLQAGQFVNCLTIKDQHDESSISTDLITAVYLEASNASGYIRNGFQLLLPVMQLAIVKAHPMFKESDN